MTFPFLQKHPRKRTMHYGVTGDAQVWRGPVERRDPRHYQPRPKDCGLRRCVNRWCALWIVSDATRCPHCHERQDAN